MGEHSGYDKLFIQINDKLDTKSTILNIDRDTPPNLLLRKLISPLIKYGKNYSHMYDYNLLKTELKLIYYLKLLNYRLLHITFLERNYGILRRFITGDSLKLVSTAHQPPSWWKQIGRDPAIVSTLDYLITMSKKQSDFFEQFLPGRVSFVPHAVDTDFFKPANGSRNLSNPSCVFCGTWLRDFSSLEKIIKKVISRNKSIRFDLIIPNTDSQKNNEYIRKIARHDEVRFHSGLNNKELLELYQQSTMLVLPILDATANNALLESISCGLPVVSNSVGGIVDYVNNDFAYLHENGDISSFVDSIFKIVDEDTAWEKRSNCAREYSVNNLSLELISEKTMEIYKNIQ